MKKILTVVLLYLIVLTSCVDTFRNMVFRQGGEPLIDLVNVKIEQDNSVMLSWREDSNADKFMLMRALDNTNPDFTEIYSGKDLSFKDIYVLEGKKYIYRLDKKRGSKVFKGDCAGILFTSKVKDDKQNHDQNTAYDLRNKTITDTLVDVLYSYSGKKVKGENWYKITVPTGKTATYKLLQSDPIAGSLGSSTSIMSGADSEVLKEGSEIKLENTDIMDKDYYFSLKICDNIIADEYVVTYKLEFSKIE